MASSRRKIDDPYWSSSDEDDDDEELDGGGGDDFDDDDERFYPICSYSHADPSASPSFTDLASALQHDASNYGFDLLAHLPSSNDDDGFFEGAIKTVNRCRGLVRERDGRGVDADNTGSMDLGREIDEYLTANPIMGGDGDDDDDMTLYKPVLEDDAMLMCMEEMQQLKRKWEEMEDKEKGGAPASRGSETVSRRVESSDAAMAKGLQERISQLEEQLNRARVCIASLANDDDDDDDGPSSDDDNSCSDDDRKADKRDKEEEKKEEKKKKKKKKKKKLGSTPDNDTYYFSSYSNTSIHETMLRDTVRTAAYEDAILSNSPTLFKGKTVLDIGCGTGVLSLFCAKAGARRVIAVDNSDVIHQARKIVDLNGYGDVVTCVRGKVETLLDGGGLPLDDGEKVDVVVSEWMGYALFFETMLPSVLAARDRVMRPGTGTMFPNISRIYIEGANAKERLEYWDDVHSLNMAPMRERMVQELTKEAFVEVVDDADIVTDRVLAIEHDLNTCKDGDLDFEVPFKLRLRDDRGGVLSDDDDDDAAVEVHKLVISFDIDFAVPGTNAVGFSTGCQSVPTHWKQTVLWFDPLRNTPKLGRGGVMRGMFRMRRNEKNHRDIDVAVAWEVGREDGDGGWTRTMDGFLRRSLIA